jgi:hypothetical protein
MRHRKKHKDWRTKFNLWGEAVAGVQEWAALLAILLPTIALLWLKSYADFMLPLAIALFFLYFCYCLYLTKKRHEELEKEAFKADVVAELLKFRERGEALLSWLSKVPPSSREKPWLSPDRIMTADETSQVELWRQELEAYVKTQLGESYSTLLGSRTGLAQHIHIPLGAEHCRLYETVHYRLERIHEFVRDLRRV